MKKYRPHKYSPKAWRKTPQMTGDYDFDASITHTKNKDAKGKIETHLLSEEAYGPRTNYGGYSGYSGDD